VPQRITPQTTRLLEVLLSDSGRDWYGFELMELAGLSSGTAYPMLHRLTSDGWLTSYREDADPHQEGRPRRRLYRLTGEGRRAGREVVAARTPATQMRLDRQVRPQGATT
jgi:PadR family transcriptional regulator PadR